MVGAKESCLGTFSYKIQPMSFSFDLGDIKGPVDMCFGSGVV